MSDYHKQKLDAEQAAGRRAIEAAVAAELLAKGSAELRRRFPSYLENPHLHKSADGEWMVEVRVQTATGTYMNFTTPFLGFPSDLLITQIALVV